MGSARGADELEGYLEGVRRRVGERRALGPIDPDWVRRLSDAEQALRAGDLEVADRILRALDAVLDSLREEVELTERPRGLVGYVPRGNRGVPPGPEEEALANRIRLVVRLLAVRESEGLVLEEARRGLERARQAYAAGDRATARLEVDRAHELVESGTRGDRRRPTP